ncbi:MAG: bifunctional homocysteine S-methyltransferase/methylenetetrahydrofolate reductase [Bacteroidota bacterium]
MKKPFRDRLRDGPILCDGAMGTLLDMYGYRELPHEMEVLRHPEIVEQIHREYRDAGAEILETNTFGANALRLAEYHLEDHVREINLRAVEIARGVAEDSLYVAGAVGPTGKFLEPIGPLKKADARAVFREQIEVLVESGVDLIMLETFVSLDELDEAIAAVKEVADIPIVAQRAFPEDGSVLATNFPAEVLEHIWKRGVDVVGSNCTVGPQRMFTIMRTMHNSGVYLSAQPAAGVPTLVDGRAVYHATPEYLAIYARELLKTGVTIIGACCGSTPDHIRSIAKVVKEFRETSSSTEEVRITEATDRIRSQGQPQSRPNERDTSAASFVNEPATVRLREEKRESAPGEQLKNRSVFASNIGKKFLTSVELDVPRGIDLSSIFEGATYLKQQGIDAINITDGARARLRMSPIAISHLVQQRIGIEAITHMACRDRNLLGLQSDLLAAHALGIRNILAVTGDPTSIGDYPQATSVFDIDSIGLIRAINAMNHGQDIMGNSLGDRTSFLIACAVNPLADNPEREIERLTKKIESGAEIAFTQPIYELQTLEHFLLKIEHLRIPLMVGILPLRSYRHAEFLHNEVPGISIPERIRERLRNARDRAPVIGVEIAGEFLHEIRTMVQGAYLMPPFRKYHIVIDILGMM